MIHSIRNVATALLLLSAGALYAGEAADTTASAQAPEKLQFTFTDTHGQTFHLVPTDKGLSYPEFKGKKVFTIFYIYSGTPCRNELQTITKLKPKLPDMEFVAFELKGLKPDQLKAFEKELKLKGIHMVDTAQAMPFAQFIAKAAQWKGSVPLIILSNGQGEVKHMQLGAMSAQEIEEYDKKL